MEFYGHVIDGQEVASVDGATFEDVDPYTREVWATIALGGKADADLAVAAARRAFDDGPGRASASRSGSRSSIGSPTSWRSTQTSWRWRTRATWASPSRRRATTSPGACMNFRFFADHARMSTADTLPMDTGHHAYTRYDPGWGRRCDLPLELPAHAGHVEGSAPPWRGGTRSS